MGNQNQTVSIKNMTLVQAMLPEGFPFHQFGIIERIDEHRLFVVVSWN